MLLARLFENRKQIFFAFDTDKSILHGNIQLGVKVFDAHMTESVK